MKRLAPVLFAVIIALSAMGEVVWAGEKDESGCEEVNQELVAAHIWNEFKGRFLRMKCEPNESNPMLSVRVLTQNGKVRNIQIPRNQMVDFRQ